MGNQEKLADVRGCVRRRPRNKNLEAREVRDVKDFWKFVPKDLSKATAINKMKLVLVVIQAQRTSSPPGGKTANTSAQGEGVEEKAIVKRALVRSEKRGERLFPNGWRNMSMAGNGPGGPVEGSKGRSKKATG